MKKAMKKPKRGAQPPKTSIDETIDRAIAGLCADIDSSSGLERAKLASRLYELAESKRKSEAAKRRETATLTVEAVVLWARGLDAGVRIELLRELTQLDSKRSGLA